MTNRDDTYARVLVRVAEDAVVNNRIGQYLGLVAAISTALTVAVVANNVIP